MKKTKKSGIHTMGGEALKQKILASGKTMKEYFAPLQKKGVATRKRNQMLKAKQEAEALKAVQ